MKASFMLNLQWSSS